MVLLGGLSEINGILCFKNLKSFLVLCWDLSKKLTTLEKIISSLLNKTSGNR